MNSIKLLFSLFFLLTLTTSFAQWTPTTGIDGGLARTMDVIDGVVWAGTKTGVIKSFDDGQSWEHTTIAPPQSVITKITHFENEIFIMVTEFTDLPGNFRMYLYRSPDSGATWEINVFPTNFSSTGSPNIFRMTDGILYCSSQAGLYQSTDNGATWALVPSFNHINSFAHDEKTILVSKHNSTSYISSDYGSTWTFLDSLPKRQAFIEDSLIIYQQKNSLFVSNDLGETFVEKTGFLNVTHHEQSIFRAESGRLIFINSDIFESTDNGETWSSIGSVPWDDSQTNAIDINGHLLLANNYGIFEIMPTEYVYRNNGFVGSNVSSLFISPNGVLYGTKESSVFIFKSTDNGINWQKTNIQATPFAIKDIVFLGDTTVIATRRQILMTQDTLVHSLSSNLGQMIQSVTIDNNKLYACGNGFGIVASDDFGQSWDTINHPSGSFIDPADFSIANGHFIYRINDGTIYTSTDQGANWILTKGPDPKYQLLKIKYIGTRVFLEGSKWVSDDYGLTWHDLSPQGLPLKDTESYIPNKITGNGDTIFCTIPYHGVFVSFDKGDHWVEMNHGLKSLRTTVMAYNGTHLVVGTENLGVWIHDATINQKTGFAYNDINDNSIWDTGEPPLEGIMVQSAQSICHTDSNGQFSLTTSIPDSIKAIAPNAFAAINPTDGHAISTANTGYDFGIHFDTNHPDLEIVMTNLFPFRPGFDNKIFITVKNIGTTTLEPKVTLNLTDDLAILGASPALSSQNTNTYTWDLSSLNTLETTDIIVDINVSTNALLGNYFTITSTVDPTANDETPNNNLATIDDVFVGSFDPNDKKVAPTTNYPPEYLDDNQVLTYTIRFQNTGTYQADNVSVVDTLSQYLDLSTLRIITSSHPTNWSISNTNVLTFLFNNINLPDSVANEVGSHGFVKYSILPKSGLPLGTPIDNTASIYFDYNTPIITNTVETKFDRLLPICTAKPVNDLDIYPNPANHHIRLTLARKINGTGPIEIFDIRGRTVLAQKIDFARSQAKLSLPNLPSGEYLVKLTIQGQHFASHLIIANK